MRNRQHPSQLLHRWITVYAVLGATGIAWAVGVLATPASVPARPLRKASAPPRNDPYPSFNFQVPLGQAGPSGGFTEVSGMAANAGAERPGNPASASRSGKVRTR